MIQRKNLWQKFLFMIDMIFEKKALRANFFAVDDMKKAFLILKVLGSK